jgi:hypothetical protein
MFPRPTYRRHLVSIYQMSQALMAHACDPSYSGGRDWEDHGLGKNVCETLSRKTLTKIGLVEWLKVKTLNSSPSTTKKKKKKKKPNE